MLVVGAWFHAGADKWLRPLCWCQIRCHRMSSEKSIRLIVHSMLGTPGSSFLIRKGDLSRRSWPLPARIQCFKSSGQDFSPCSSVRCIIWLGVDLDICISWYGDTHVLRLSSSSRCGIGSILLSVFMLVDPRPSLDRVWELKNSFRFCSKCTCS